MSYAPAPARLLPAFSDDWRRWVAENLMLDVGPDAVVATLVANGFPAAQATREVQQALASPYLAGARQGRSILHNRLAKRDWLLDIYRKLNRQRDGEGSGAIERRHRLTRDEFYQQYYLANRPVIISGMLDNWPAMHRWNFDYLRQHFGEREVEVQMGRNRDVDYEINSPQHKQLIRFGDYIDMVLLAGNSNDFYMTANNSSRNKQALRELWQDIELIPEYLDPDSEQDGFFWFGPAGTRTPFHHDLTNNFLAQVMGRKHVKLIPACELANVYNHKHCYTPVDGSMLDFERFPLLREVQLLECILEPGELLFLPVGCWHYVEGLDPSISMSFINFRLDNDYASFYRTYQAV